MKRDNNLRNQDFSIMPFMNPHNVLKEVAEQNNIAIKHIFGEKIRGSFLIKIKDQVLKELGLENFRRYYDFRWSNVEMITGLGEAPEYDICRIVVGIHRAYSVFCSKQEIRENEKNDRYRKQIVSETIEKIKLRLYASVYFRRKILFPGEEFLYYPLPYELFAMAVKMNELLRENSNIIYWQLYDGILHNVLSALSLMEDNLLGGAYPLCRGAIEMYVKFLVLNEQSSLYAYYEKFRMYEVEQSCCSQKYPEEFYELFNTRSCQNVKNKADYLHFGWVDFIHDYHTIVKQIPYSVYGLLVFLKNKNEDKISELEQLEYFYKSCHAYPHGSVQMAIYPLLHYFEISIMLYCIIRGTFLTLCAEKKIDSKIDGNDIISMIDRDFDILWKQYQKRSTESFKRYYQ